MRRNAFDPIHATCPILVVVLLLAIAPRAGAQGVCRIAGTNVNVATSITDDAGRSASLAFREVTAWVELDERRADVGFPMMIVRPIAIAGRLTSTRIDEMSVYLPTNVGSLRGTVVARADVQGRLRRTIGARAEVALVTTTAIRFELPCAEIAWGEPRPSMPEIAAITPTTVELARATPVRATPDARSPIDAFIIDEGTAGSIVETRGAFGHLVGCDGFVAVDGWIPLRDVRRVRPTGAGGVGLFGAGMGTDATPTLRAGATRESIHLEPGHPIYCGESATTPCSLVTEPLDVEVARLPDHARRVLLWTVVPPDPCLGFEGVRRTVCSRDVRRTWGYFVSRPTPADNPFMTGGDPALFVDVPRE